MFTKVPYILEWKGNTMSETTPTVGYGDFRANTDPRVEVKTDSTQEIAPGEFYTRPEDRPVSLMTPATVDPNIGRFTKGTVGENGIGQPIENTQEGMSFSAPLFGYAVPSHQRNKKRDAGRTAIDVARETIRLNEAQAEADQERIDSKETEDKNSVTVEDTFPEDFMESDEK